MKNVPIYIDLGFCLIFLPLMILAFPVERWWWTYPVYFGLFVAWLYLTYFLYKYLIVTGLCHDRRQRTVALVAMAASIAVTFIFASYEITSPFYHFRMQNPDMIPAPKLGVRQNQQAVWLHYIIVVIFTFAVGLLTESFRQRIELEEAEYERNNAELALYKAQINPHFLFNTLNTIYGLLITKSDQAETALEQFIGLTKYMYGNASRDYIPLSEEVEYIDRYIGLQKLRLNEYADVTFGTDIDDPDVSIPPAMLVTFVENAFKYGISSNEHCFVHILLEQKAGHMRFEVVNSLFPRRKSDSSGIGIENCRKRLGLLYPGRHRLECGETGGVFRVLLELDTAID
ncbi:MAG: sensor histidine kinase [Candidatus Cryptobacteroides sp.]